MLQAILDSVTLGALIQTVPPPVTAYIALLTVVLFLVGVFLLPGRRGLTHHPATTHVASEPEDQQNEQHQSEESAPVVLAAPARAP